MNGFAASKNTKYMELTSLHIDAFCGILHLMNCACNYTSLVSGLKMFDTEIPITETDFVSPSSLKLDLTSRSCVLWFEQELFEKCKIQVVLWNLY